MHIPLMALIVIPNLPKVALLVDKSFIKIIDSIMLLCSNFQKGRISH